MADKTQNNFPAFNVKKSGFDYNEFKTKNIYKILILSFLLFCIFLFSVFKNISYPLFWGDESSTAVGSERVLEYGYPKVHDGKNVFYLLRHSNPKLGIKEKDDAFIEGTGWGQYYYGTIGYLLAEDTDNIYTKTGIYRATFAIAGILGMLLMIFFISRLFPDNFSRFAFIMLFLLFSLISVSLTLLLREVRYYSLVVFLSGLIVGAYLSFRFYKPFNIITFIGIESIALWMTFITFSPLYIIINLTIGITELIIFINQYLKSDFISAFKKALPVVIFLIISLGGVIPLLSYFKYFEISNAISEFNGFDNEMYIRNVLDIFTYFGKFELLFLAIVLKIFLVLNFKKFIFKKNSLFKVSSFLTLFFLISIFIIARIPNFIYTRYIIFLQPFLSIIIILDFFIILQLFSINSNNLINNKILLLVILFSGLFIYSLSSNFKYIKGHIYEISHQYKGPLDYTIPFIQEQFLRTDTLVIATNYEETSYMYYLKCKTIIGFTGNNLTEDSLLKPHIIAYRKLWNNYTNIFDRFLRKSKYTRISFPVYDNLINNIPEFNFIPSLNHQFKTLLPENDDYAVWIFVKK